jgi:hypothetical protein
MFNRFSATPFFLLSCILLMLGCGPEKQEKEPVDPPDTLTLQDGLNPVNKTRDYVLYADFKAGEVTGWEVHDNDGNSQPISFEQGTVKGTSMVKCQVCIDAKEKADDSTSRKCWEIPCDSVPEETEE